MSETQTEERLCLLRSAFTKIFVDVFEQKSTFNRKIERKTQDVHDLFAGKENRTLTNVLVDAAEQIFDAYQVQIFTATYGKVFYRDHLRALSKCAKLKCFNYIHKNYLSVDKQDNITSCLIIEGVLKGRLSRGSQNKLFALCDDNLQIKCPLIFEKTGLLLKSRTNQNVIEYYSKSDGSNNTNVYGYRTELRFEVQNNNKNEFHLTFSNLETLPSRSNVEVNVEEPSVLFTGRAKDLLNLHSLLFSSDWQDVRPKYVWFYGLKGVGKSETIKNYIQIHKADYDSNIVWIDCSSHEKIRKSFEDFYIVVNQNNANEIDLNELDIKSLAINSYKLLIKSKSLIVFDNVQHTSDILHVMPPQTIDFSAHFSVVITSRKTTKVIAGSNGINYVKLAFLNSEEATDFARKLFSFNAPQLVLSETSFALFIESLGCLPLTIQSGVETYFCLKKCCSRTFDLDEFLYLFNREKRKISKEDSFLAKSRKILEQIILDVDVGINARKLMEFLIYLGPCKIDIDKITRLAKEVKGIYSSVDLLHKFSLISNMFINVVLKEAFRFLLQLDKREEEVLGRIIPHHELYEMEAVWHHARKYPTLIKYAYRPVCHWSNTTPLHLLTGRTDITRDLLRKVKTISKGLTPSDITDRFGRTPLDLAIVKGHIETVVEVYGAISLEILHAVIYAAVATKNINRLESVLAGIDSKMINQKYGGMSVVHIAVRGSNIDVLNLLIDHKADLNSRNNHGVVPLHIACQYGNLEIAKKLIENGAKVSVVDSYSWTPIFYAASNGHQHVLEYFVDNNLVDGEQTDRHGHTILHVASQYGRLNNVQYLLSCCKLINLNINALAIWGNSAIFTAALNGYWDTVDCLLEGNVDVKTFDQNTFIGHLNISVLHIAAAYDNILLLEKLLKMYDLDPDTGLGFSFTPMFVAQYFQSELVLHCFRNHGYAVSINYENILRTAEKLYNEYDQKQDLCSISYTEFFKNFSKHRLKEIFVYLSPNEFKSKWIVFHRFLACLVDLNTKCMKNVIEKRFKCS